jgi:hypothetical protein
MQNLFKSLRRLAETISFALCRLNEIQFDAPWAPRRPRCG